MSCLTRKLLRLFSGPARVVCVLTAYLDEGGSYPSTDYLTVAGCIARDDDWLKITAEWQRVLCGYSVGAYHGVDCNAGREAFEGWSKPKRDAIVHDLISVLEGQRVNFLGAFTDLRQYAALAQEDAALLGHPYGVCFEFCLERIDDSPGIDPVEPIAIVFEEAKKLVQHGMGSYDAMKLKPRWRERLVSCSKAAKKDFVPLQCADLIAYWVNKVFCEKDKVDSSFTLYTRTEFTRLSDTERMKLVGFGAKDLKLRVNQIKLSGEGAL